MADAPADSVGPDPNDPQAYYWNDEWQVGERETLIALDQGQGVRFSSGREFADWLLGDG